GREYDAIFRQSQNWEVSDLRAIMEGHNALAKSLARRCGKIVVEDTDAIQTLVWAEALLGYVPEELVQVARDASSGKSYVLLSEATPWIDDGTRYFPDLRRRAWFTERLRDWLTIFNSKWHYIDQIGWRERSSATLSLIQPMKQT